MAGAENPAEILRKHFLVGNARSYPLDALRSRLEDAGRLAPDDDRVWLGKANLAIRTAQFAEAEDWLKRCLGRRPEDPAIWRARLEWAMATDRVADAVEALRHLPADRLTPEALLSTRAWLAARLGDARAEQDAVTRWLERVPGEFMAVDRLIALKTQAGQAEEVVGAPPPQGGARPGQRRLSPDAGRAGPRRAFRRAGPAGGDPGPMVRGARLVDARLARVGRLGRGPRGPGPHRSHRARSERRPIARGPPVAARRHHGRRAGRRHPARRRGPGRLTTIPRRPSQASATTPGLPASTSSMRTTPRRCAGCPRRWAAAWACSTTTATAGSTSTPSRAGRSPTSRTRRRRRRETGCSATVATARSRT